MSGHGLARHVIAGNILHGFAEPWTEVAATYGVHIASVAGTRTSTATAPCCAVS